MALRPTLSGQYQTEVVESWILFLVNEGIGLYVGSAMVSVLAAR